VTTESRNVDARVVEGFGEEWQRFDQRALTTEEALDLFDKYFEIFPWDALPQGAVGFDAGCGSGRWAQFVAPRVGVLHCVDASRRALDVAFRTLADKPNCHFHLAPVDDMPLRDEGMDFGYSLGVLHHIPDTVAALRACVRKLKPGAPLLVYLYYRFDNRPLWFRAIWAVSDGVRRVVSKMPFRLRSIVSDVLATAVYWPLATTARLADRAGVPVDHWPLSGYRHHSFYVMRTDALDRFGTRLEQRFTQTEIRQMLLEAGLSNIKFRHGWPYWVAVGTKSTPPTMSEALSE
jgi:SAM-dependent methyltransferase